MLLRDNPNVAGRRSNTGWLSAKAVSQAHRKKNEEENEEENENRYRVWKTDQAKTNHWTLFGHWGSRG